MGVAVPLAAVAKGATVIEKHFTLSQKMYGSDAMNSIEPEDFKRLVNEIRQIHIALSSYVDKDEKVSNLKNMKRTFEKSVVSSRPISESEVITEGDLAFKKPGDGIPARKYKEILGKKINKCVDKDHQFIWTDFE